MPSNIDKQNKNGKVKITSDMVKINKNNITQIDYKSLARALKVCLKIKILETKFNV